MREKFGKTRSNFVLPAISLWILLCSTAQAADPKPKYGSEAATLSQSHDYFKKNDAPDYWAVAPYYVPQRDGKSCSLASVTMVVNALRAGKKLTADDELVTQDALLKKADNSFWNKALSTAGRGVPLDQLGPIVEDSLKAYGFKQFKVEVIHMTDLHQESLDRLHGILVENEKSSRNFVIANFIQGVYTGDADAGHIAPVGAYDAKKKQVLIMDPDRQWYEPYWVSEATFAKGMATPDPDSGKNRGYVWIQLKNEP